MAAERELSAEPARADMVLYFNHLPAFREAVRQDALRRDRDYLGRSHFICGIRIRAMSLRDFQILDEIKSPFLYQRAPTLRELVFFLWLLSPQIEQWHDEKGWRKQWIWGCRLRLFSVEYWQSVFHGFKCRRKLKLAELSRGESREAKGTVTVPTGSKVERAIKESFEYVERMFQDRPRGGAGEDSYFSYLAGWADIVRSEYRCPEAEVITMPLPKLWQVIRAIHKRKDPNATWGSPEGDKVKRGVMKAIGEKRFTLDDFIAGKPKWDGSNWN